MWQSDVILLMTCSVREGAEQKIWNRLEFLKSLKLARQRLRSSQLPPMKIGILGCQSKQTCFLLLGTHLQFLFYKLEVHIAFLLEVMMHLLSEHWDCDLWSTWIQTFRNCIIVFLLVWDVASHTWPWPWLLTTQFASFTLYGLLSLSCGPWCDTWDMLTLWPLTLDLSAVPVNDI